MSLSKVVLIGSTGSGKSSLANTLCGLKNEFIVGGNIESVTSETLCKLISWKNTESQAYIIDTPGLADSLGRDSIHIAEMVLKLREIKEVNAFLIVLNGNQARFDIHLQAMLSLFQEMFGTDFI